MTSTKAQPSPTIARSRNILDGTRVETWRPIAPTGIIEAYTEADGQEGWEAWTDHLAARKGRPTLDRMLPDGESALLWAMPVALLNTDTADLAARLGRQKSFRKRHERRHWADEATAWLDTASIASASPSYGYECLAWAYALTRLPLCLGETLWWRLVSHLVTVACDARLLPSDHDPLTWQLLGGELPLALAYQLFELRACHDLAIEAWGTVSAGLNELVDREGLPKPEHAGLLPSLLACWTRARAMAERLEDRYWQDPAACRFERAIVGLARLTKHDRSLLFGEHGSLTDRALWRACASFDLDKPARRVAKQLACQQPKSDAIDSPSAHSEANHLAVMRTAWSKGSPQLGVAYGGREVKLELIVGRETMWSGEWRAAVKIDGSVGSQTGSWEALCWSSDDDVDYLELEAPLADGCRLQRQVLLSRADRVLWLADAVLCEEQRHIDYRGVLPLDKHVQFQPEAETREGMLRGDKVVACVLPLALPEWRADHRGGTLQATEEGFELCQQRQAQSLYAPLLIDLDGRRKKKDATWRQLTVVENRQRTHANIAVGYRAQIGRRNWLIYRSLGEIGTRTVLGQHVNAEFLFGCLKTDGNCERLLEIESTDA
jgi:hypothetical protein